MNVENHERIVQILIVIELLVLGFGCAIIFLWHPENAALVTLCCAASVGVFTYTIAQYRLSRKMKKHFDDVMDALEFLSNDVNEIFEPKNKNPSLLPIYQKIEDFKQGYYTKEVNRQRILNIVNSVAVNMETEKILEELMPKLIDVTKSNCGVFYLANHSTNKLEIKKSIGFSKNVYSEFDLLIGEGFIGLPALNQEIKIVTEMPDDTIYIIRTFLGTIKPKSMMIVPIVNQEQLVGVFAFASIYEYSADQLEIVDLIKYYVGAAVGNGITFEKTKRLTNELKFQNRLIQNLNDDLEKNVQDRTLFLNDIIDSIKDYAIYAMDSDGIVLVWNKGAENLFGFSSKETIGKHIENIYPADEVQAGYVQRKIDSVLRDGRYIENGWRFRKDGSSYYAETVLFARYDHKGDVIGFTNVTKDITSQKNIESDLWFEKELSTQLIETSVSALVFTDDEGYIQTTNKAAVDLLGNDLFPGQLIYEFFEGYDELKEKVECLLETGAYGEWVYKLANDEQPINIQLNIIINEADYTKILLFRLF